MFDVKKFTLGFILLFILCSALVSLLKINVAKAEPKTIVVPDDYLTIGWAIGNASEGDTIFVKKGTYEEHSLVVNKTLSLVGEDADSTIIKDIDPEFISTEFPPINSVTIKINSNGIKISGLTLTGGALGVAGSGVGTQIVGNIIIAPYGCINLKGSNQTIAQNTIKNPYPASGTYSSGYGIHIRGSYNSIIANSIVGANSDSITLEGESNVVYGNAITDATNGILVNGNINIIAKNNVTVIGGGIYIDNGSYNAVYANRITDGGGLAVIRGYNNTFYANYVANNMVGATIGGSQDELNYETEGPWTSNNRVYHNNFINNEVQVNTDWVVYGTDYFDDGKEGNYWSNYVGTDNNGDGIGDTPYVIDANRTDRYPLMAPFDISSITIQLPDWASPLFTSSLEPQQSEPFPTTLLVAAIAIIAVVGVALLVYFATVRKTTGEVEK